MRKTGTGWVLVMAVGVLCEAGCGGSQRQPALVCHPVKGEVVYKGGQPLSGGLVEFLPAEETGQRAVGDIQPDGKFQLSTFHGNAKVPGAVEGEYRVTISLPPGEQHAPPPPINLPQTYRVQPQENEFRIEVPTPRR